MKRLIPLFLLSLVLLVGVASAAATFTNFATYGDAFKSTNDTYTVILWNATGARAAWNTTGNITNINVPIDYVVVAGGGGGGKALGGGGGGAGTRYNGGAAITSVATGGNTAIIRVVRDSATDTLSGTAQLLRLRIKYIRRLA